MEDIDQPPEELGIRLDWPDDPLEIGGVDPHETFEVSVAAEGDQVASEPDAAALATVATEPSEPSPLEPTPLERPEPLPPRVPQPLTDAPPQADLSPLLARMDALTDTSLAFQRTIGERLTDYAAQVSRMSTSVVSELGEDRLAQEGVRHGLKSDLDEFRRTQESVLNAIRGDVDEIAAAMRRLIATTLDISSELGSLVVATRQASTQMSALVSDVEAVVRRVDTDLHRTISESEAQQSSQRREMAALREELAVVHEELKGVRRRLPVASRARGAAAAEPEPDAAIAEAREARAARDLSAVGTDEPRPRRRRA